MKKLRIAIFFTLFVSSIVYAASEKLSDQNETLICHLMKLIKNNATAETVRSNTEYLYREYFLRITSDPVDDPIYHIYVNKHQLNQIILKDIGFLIHTNANICEDLKNNQYIIIKNEWEDEDASSGTGILVIEISNNTAKKLYRDNFDDERYTPKKLLEKQKYLPITHTLFEKDGGLYMKVGSTYKSDIITLKKPKSGK